MIKSVNDRVLYLKKNVRDLYLFEETESDYGTKCFEYQIGKDSFFIEVGTKYFGYFGTIDDKIYYLSENDVYINKACQNLIEAINDFKYICKEKTIIPDSAVFLPYEMGNIPEISEEEFNNIDLSNSKFKVIKVNKNPE